MTTTHIYKLVDESELPVGTLDDAGIIYRSNMATGRQQIGRIAQGVLYRITAHDERELGRVDAQGHVHSHGLFEGGALGWTDPDGVVVRGGLIFGEEEVGRIEGPLLYEGGAALLLLFLPEDDEASHRQTQRN
ncbi:MAG: hypothetical protein WDZ49_14535 [Litorilinea sp.]